MGYSQVSRSQRDRLLESKALSLQRHKLWRKPIQMHGASKTLQRFDHGCFSAVVGRSMSSPSRYPSEECYLCLPRQAYHRRFFPQPTVFQVYLLLHSQTPFCLLLLSFFSSDYFWLLLPRKAIFLFQFLVTSY